MKPQELIGNREIKSKLWDTLKKEWIEDRWIKSGDLKGNGDWISFEVENSDPTQICFGNPYPRERFIEVQYTGLKDKNGKDIYEGDILDGGRNGYTGSPSIVKWDKEGAYFHVYRGEVSSGYTMCGESRWSEIIGNIFDNPEL